MGLSHSPRIVTSGLVMVLDAANTKSYPGSGTTWTDVSSNGNNGTLTNGPTFSSGSIVFDGVNDYVRVTSSSIINLTNNFSVEIWYKTNNNTPHLWFSRYSNGGFMIGKDTGRNVWKITKYSVVDIFVGTVPQDTNWHQVVCVFSSTAGSFIYIDGSLNGSDVDTSNVFTPLLGYFDLGLAEFGNLNGNISNCKVYNKVLTADEIRQNYNAYRGRYSI